MGSNSATHGGLAEDTLNKDFFICVFPRANHALANVVDGEPIPVRESCVTPWLQEHLN